MFGDIANGIGKDAGQNWADWLKYARQYNPQLQAGIADASNNLSSAGRFNTAVRGGNFARAQAMSQSTPLAYSQNPFMAQAYRGQQLNKANDYGNQAIQKSQSPEAATQAWQQLLGMLGGAQNYAHAPFAQAAQMSYGAPKVQVGPGFLDYAAQAAGIASGRGSVGNSGGGGGYDPVQYNPGDLPNPGTPYDWLAKVPWTRAF